MQEKSQKTREGSTLLPSYLLLSEAGPILTENCLKGPLNPKQATNHLLDVLLYCKYQTVPFFRKITIVMSVSSFRLFRFCTLSCLRNVSFHIRRLVLKF